MRLVCEAANTVFDITNQNDFLNNVQEMGSYLRERLVMSLKDDIHAMEIRSCGLLFGILVDQGVETVVDKARDEGLLILTVRNGDVLRVAPPLNTTREEIDEAIEKLEVAFRVLQ